MSEQTNGNATASASANGGHHVHGKKRIVVCCDGTWQDAFISKNPGKYTNVIKLARMVYHLDPRDLNKAPIPQIVFYQSGVGTDQPLILEYIQGATGSSLRGKVQEAYGFICHNYHPGDEIFLFGFSRGAYTARMVAFFIGKIGILDKKDLVHFAEVFDWLQDLEHPAKQGKEERQRLEEIRKILDPIVQTGKMRADPDGDDFTVKVLGVFDTVGSLGLPKELTLFPKMAHFGLSDEPLGMHVQHAYQAIAINETRKDFDIVRFQQMEEGLKKNQTLKQVWFSGCHTDIGGGYCGHDLSDLTLIWMTSNIMDKLSLDIEYMKSMFRPTGPWGTQKPHDPTTGIFLLALQSTRTFPEPTPPSPCFPYFESIHPSVQYQPDGKIVSKLKNLIDQNPQIVWELMPFEEEMKSYWATIVIAQGEEGCKAHALEAAEADRKMTRMEEVKSSLVEAKNVFIAATAGLARKATLKGRSTKNRSRISWAGPSIAPTETEAGKA